MSYRNPSEVKFGNGGYVMPAPGDDRYGDVLPLEDGFDYDPDTYEQPTLFDEDGEVAENVLADPQPEIIGVGRAGDFPGVTIDYHAQFEGDYPKTGLLERAEALDDILSYYNQDAKVQGAKDDAGRRSMNPRYEKSMLPHMQERLQTLEVRGKRALAKLAMNDGAYYYEIGDELRRKFRHGVAPGVDARVRDRALSAAVRAAGMSRAQYDRTHGKK